MRLHLHRGKALANWASEVPLPGWKCAPEGEVSMHGASKTDVREEERERSMPINSAAAHQDSQMLSPVGLAN